MAPLPVPTIGGNEPKEGGKEAKESVEKKESKEFIINQDNWHDTKLLGVKE
jgi:hypothetical protein